MSELYKAYRNQMKAAKTYAAMDAVETAAFRSYLSDKLTDSEYSQLYSLGTTLINNYGWH